MFGVNLIHRDSVDSILGFQDEFGLTFSIVLDIDDEVARTYKAFGQPFIFVNNDGTVNKAFINEHISELLGS